MRSTLIFGSFSGASAVGISLYDPDGGLIQECRLYSEETSTLSLDSLMEGCKFESGMRHAHLIVRHTEDTLVKVHVSTHDATNLLEPAREVTDSLRMGFPVSLGGKKNCWLALLNTSSEETTVRGRLFIGNRSPEVAWRVAGLGCRIVNITSDLEAILAEYSVAAPVGEGKPSVTGYLRLVNSVSNPVMTHLMEWDAIESEPLLSVVN